MAARPTNIRSALLSLAYQVLAGIEGEPTEPITISIASGAGGGSFTFTSRPGELALFQRAQELPEMVQNIVQALNEAGRDLDVDELAHASGYKNNSRFRQAVADMQKQDPPLLVRVAGKLRLSPSP